MNNKEIQEKINNSEININTNDLFFVSIIKGAINFMNNNIKVRNKIIPHYILSTGDDILYQELLNGTNEQDIYTTVPRCIIDVGAISCPTDDITQGNITGNFDIEVENELYNFNCKFKRMPVKLELSLKYIIDSFTDSLELSQYLYSKLGFSRTFYIVYMGKSIQCSIQLPTNFTNEKDIEVSYDNSDNKRMLSIDLDIATNFPIWNEKTAIISNNVIKTTQQNINTK